MAFKTRKTCSSCLESNFLKPVLQFGKIPLAGYFPTFEQIRNTQDFDCNLLFCDNCGLLQVDTIVDSSILFKDYRYMSSIGLTSHFTNVAKYLNDRFSLKTKGGTVLEIGSNDGVLLKPLMDLGIRAKGFEPSNNISKVAKEKGCDIIVDFFNLESTTRNNLEKWADIIVANNVFAHIDDLSSVVEGIKYCLKDDGSFVAEVHYLAKLVLENQYDFIYHEHIFYHSIYGLDNLFRKHGMTLYDFDQIEVHSGSIRIFAKKGIAERTKKISSQIEYENSIGITNSDGFSRYGMNVSQHINKSRETIDFHVNNGRSIIGFGASGRCNIQCNLMKLGTQHIPYIYDESPERINRFIPKSNIPIVKFDEAGSLETYDLVLIFAWNYSSTIMNKIKAKDYLILFPNPHIVKSRNLTEE